MNWKFWLHWPPLVIGGFIIGAFCGSGVVPMYMLMVYGGIWGLVYGIFYRKIIEPMLDKKEDDE